MTIKNVNSNISETSLLKLLFGKIRRSLVKSLIKISTCQIGSKYDIKHLIRRNGKDSDTNYLSNFKKWYLKNY